MTFSITTFSKVPSSKAKLSIMSLSITIKKYSLSKMIHGAVTPNVYSKFHTLTYSAECCYAA